MFPIKPKRARSALGREFTARIRSRLGVRRRIRPELFGLGTENLAQRGAPRHARAWMVDPCYGHSTGANRDSASSITCCAAAMPTCSCGPTARSHMTTTGEQCLGQPETLRRISPALDEDLFHRAICEAYWNNVDGRRAVLAPRAEKGLSPIRLLEFHARPPRGR